MLFRCFTMFDVRETSKKNSEMRRYDFLTYITGEDYITNDNGELNDFSTIFVTISNL